jgi:EF hand
MISRRTAILSILAVGGVFAGRPPAVAKSMRADPLSGLDTDNDGTVDLAEAKKAAAALFDRLDINHEGTLDRREVGRRLSAKEFAAADVDKDKMLTTDEYLTIVEQRFKATDTDNDGTLTGKELQTKAARAFLRLLK